MTQLKGAVVLITGAAGGFGQELTKQLLSAGSRLILSDRDEKQLWDRAESLGREIATGEILACLGVDLGDRQGCETLYHRVQALGIAVDVLINNAGIGLFGRIDEVPTEKWEKLLQINLLAPMRLSSLFVADMIARRRGHIVNISSIAGWAAPAGLAHYSASKFGLRGFSEGLLREVKFYNVNVTVVYPFFSRTAILHSPQYGTLATHNSNSPKFVSDPAQIMGKTIQAIARNQFEVFPDAIAQLIHLSQQYFPGGVFWFSELFRRKPNNAGY
ncbi:MAG: SDR family NAD(P)-dependent oxidoreductase [Chloroflexaceae bacterium]|nr:SDR family NAD(P)-dependent oxidoreductase [Chloroflexaceae bacterium]